MGVDLTTKNFVAKVLKEQKIQKGFRVLELGSQDDREASQNALVSLTQGKLLDFTHISKTFSKNAKIIKNNATTRERERERDLDSIDSIESKSKNTHKTQNTFFEIPNHTYEELRNATKEQLKQIATTLNEYTCRVSTAPFYAKLGAQEYTCIDLDGAFGSLPFNLNFEAAALYGYKEQFELITNFGTSEHLLNQAAAFANIHNFCAKDGIMISGVPIFNSLNHGLFTYSLKFFARLGVFNNYEFCGAQIVGIKYDKDGNQTTQEPCILEHLDDTKSAYSYFKNQKSEFLDFEASASATGFVLFCAFKKLKNDPFVYPIDMPLKSIKNSDTLRFFLTNRTDTNEPHKTKSIKIPQKVAIFGAGEAGKIAYEFLKSAKIKILCFIDDFKKGEYLDTKIVNSEIFKKDFMKNCEAIVKGPLQKGELRDFELPLININWVWIG